MKVVLQRVSSASVVIDGKVHASIQQGLLILLGIAPLDTHEDVAWLCTKIVSLRIFPDDEGLMNRSVKDCGGEILVVSQFTLFADTRKGTRPSFNHAARPEIAEPLYRHFLAQLESALGRQVAAGEFGADMKVALVNDGPVTLIIDSPPRS